MFKGIVMEMTEADLVVLTPDGQFKKIPRMGRVCQVGEEVLFSTPPFRLKRPVLSAMFALTAAVLFCIVLFNGLGGNLEGVKPIVAYVTLDINPSVELGVDKDNEVQEARGLNEDGVELLQSLELTGRPLAAATEVLLNHVEQKGIFSQEEGDIIISSTKVYEEAKVDESSLGQIVKETVSKHIETKHPQATSAFQVAAFVTPPTIREEALAKGLSAGKYAIYLSAKDNGNDIDLNALRDDSVHKIAKEAGGLNKLIDPKELPKKETLSKLLEAEKKGELDAKVKEKSEKDKSKSDDKKNGDKKNDDKKTTPPPNKPASTTPSKTDGKSSDPKKNGNDDKNDKDDKKNTDSGQKPGTTPAKNPPAANNGGNSGVTKPKDDDDKRAEDDRKKEEEKRKEEERKKEEEKRKEDERKKEEENRKEEERKKEEQKKAEELKKKEEEKRKEDERKRQNGSGGGTGKKEDSEDGNRSQQGR
ncbi:anti-sigma factor domain-containing protein [Paenibacillus flagellatus]|uniref:Protein RsgI n=1 Tax=Paenibacillus flagellatus TaxID=2211139 RepID=A0A2V5K1L6_9BACL|nr:anti-sigma factor domain-containing protein [Paenibacillus flagellatus]PYI53038.1 protein RsgI [Paenibacillus flagellatus]